MDLHHSVVELEVLLARIGRGELDPGWSPTAGWDRRRQQLLVDTVLRSWPIPPIVIADGNERDVVLDGRERLLALWRFVQDEIPLASSSTSGAGHLDHLDGRRHSQVPEPVRRGLRRYGVPVVRVPSADDDEVRELMARWAPSRPAPAPAPAPTVRTARSPQEPPPREPVPGRPGGAHRRPSSGEPIFDELSAWFLDAAEESPEPAWSSPADTGHHAARAALQQPAPGLTPAGLPIREPAAHLAPGAIHDTPRPGPSRHPDARDARDARLVGEHLTRLRHGTAAARGELSPPA